MNTIPFNKYVLPAVPLILLGQLLGHGPKMGLFYSQK